jgi:hypothetical protein
MEPRVMAMWSHARKVRSLAKKVLGSSFMGSDLATWSCEMSEVTQHGHTRVKRSLCKSLLPALQGTSSIHCFGAVVS